MACAQIPYALGQGIFERVAGNCGRPAGIQQGRGRAARQPLRAAAEPEKKSSTWPAERTGLPSRSEIPWGCARSSGIFDVRTRHEERTMTGLTAESAESGFQRGKIFVAIELSKAKWVVALRVPHLDKVSLFEIAGGDAERLLGLLARGFFC